MLRLLGCIKQPGGSAPISPLRLNLFRRISLNIGRKTAPTGIFTGVIFQMAASSSGKARAEICSSDLFPRRGASDDRNAVRECNETHTKRFLPMESLNYQPVRDGNVYSYCWLFVDSKNRTVTRFQTESGMAAIKGTSIAILSIDTYKIFTVRAILQGTGTPRL